MHNRIVQNQKEIISIFIFWIYPEKEIIYTFIKVMSMQTPPLGDKVCPSMDVAPPYGTIGTWLQHKQTIKILHLLKNSQDFYIIPWQSL